MRRPSASSSRWRAPRSWRAPASRCSSAAALRDEGLAAREQLRTLDHPSFVRLAERLHALAAALQILLVVGDRERRRVVSVAQVVELVRDARQRGLGRGVRGLRPGDRGFQRRDLGLEVAHLAHAGDQTSAGGRLLSAAHHALGREHAAVRRDEDGRDPAPAVDLEHLLERIDQVDAAEQPARERLVARPRPHAAEQRLSERDEALALRRGLGQGHEDAAPGLGLAQPCQRLDGAARALDHDRLGALGEHGLDGALRFAVHLEHVAHETAHTQGAARALVPRQQRARAGADVLAPLEHLAQRGEPRAPRLPRLAPLAQPQARLAGLGHGLLVGFERGAQRAHQAVALGEQVAQPFLERTLLVVRAVGLDLPDLQALVGAAQARVDRGPPIVDGRQTVLGARDARQHLDQRGVARVALAFEGL